jgi:hypothetical protein
MASKFKAGDTVRIVNYGSKRVMHVDEWGDSEKSGWFVSYHEPELIGREGVIVGNKNDLLYEGQGRPCEDWEYRIDGIRDSYPWFDENQLELA